MKKFHVVLALFIVTLVSACTKNAVIPDTTNNLSSNDVPQVAQNTLTTNFPTATNTTWSSISPTAYQAEFQSNQSTLLANIEKNGRLNCVHHKIDPATLPTAITNYLAANYSGYTIIKAGSRTNNSGVTEYMVEFTYRSNIYHIRFDATGTVLAMDTRDGAKNLTPIEPADLIRAITTYLNTNYNGYTFNHAGAIKPTNVLIGYIVNITFNGTRYGLIFDTNGSFQKIDNTPPALDGGKGCPKPIVTDVPLNQLPAPIATYLTTTYSGYTYQKSGSITLPDSSLHYLVKITYQSNEYNLEFDRAGTFIRLLK